MTFRRAALALALLVAALPPAAAGERFAGFWAGSYVCAQGSTGLSLRLRAQGDGSVVGLFHFYPQASNPQAAEGCYEVAGTPDGQGLELSAGRWLLRPENYVTVDLLGELDEDGTYFGHVEGPGCGLFALRRVARPVPPPAACGAVVSAR